MDGQKNKPTILPLSLDGRGIKGEGDPALDTGAEGENDASAPSRHCGLDPQSTGRQGDTGEQVQPTNNHTIHIHPYLSMSIPRAVDTALKPV